MMTDKDPARPLVALRSVGDNGLGKGGIWKFLVVDVHSTYRNRSLPSGYGFGLAIGFVNTQSCLVVR
jgi:hypothetical protein